MMRWARGAILCGALVATGGTCWAAGSDPVVTVNGEPITLRELEDELLRKEGVERLRELIDDRLAHIDWAALEDDDVIVEIGGRRLDRLTVAAQLLKDEGGRVRRELLNIALVRQALAAERIEIDQEVLDAEFARQETEFDRRLREKGDTIVPFVDYLRVSEEMSVEEYMQQEGFRMGAGLHELVHRRAEIEEEVLRRHFEQHRQERFSSPEAVRLRVIHIPYRSRELPDGQVVVDAEHKLTLPKVMNRIFEDIAAGNLSFVRAWQAYGRPHDPQAGEGGDVGWVDREGGRAKPGTRRIPPTVVERTFEADLADGPVLLPPVVHEQGVDLVEVTDRRAAQRPDFAAVREEVRADYIEANLDRLTQELVSEIGKEAEVEYHSLGRLTAERLREAGTPWPAAREDDAAAEPAPSERSSPP